MFSYEIDKLLRDNNYVISMSDYFSITNTSSQLRRIKLDEVYSFYSKYYIETSDNYSWVIRVLNYDVDISMKSQVKI